MRFRLTRTIACALLSGLLSLSAGCRGRQPAPRAAKAAPAKPAVKPAPLTPLDVKSAELGGPTWKPEWNAIVERYVPSSLLSSKAARDVHRFCPRFSTMAEVDKRAFWAYLFEAIASAEAGLNPRANVRHLQPTVDVLDSETHLYSRQAGLLQLKYQDAARYGCNFDWEADRRLAQKDPNRTILRPENNLRCGLNILTHQLIDRNEPLVTSQSYWEVLHPGTLAHRNFLKQMTNPPAACGLRTARRTARGAVRQATGSSDEVAGGPELPKIAAARTASARAFAAGGPERRPQ